MNFSLDTEHTVTITNGGVSLNGFLYIPQDALGIVLFVHGSGSSRFSVRNHFVAKILNKGRLASLLFDLLTPDEEAVDVHTREFRFNINLLSSRLLEATNWCLKEELNLPTAYFGSSTGAAAALIAASERPDIIQAVVSRGGRPDLAGDFLPSVQAPTLLIVGSHDDVVIELNEEALARMQCTKQLEIVPGATHLFEEPGTLEQAANLARDWFLHYLHLF
ncbi:Predicted dienelactone hydrolase [Legionella lansingensis]|uniref:Dienelactone hydrolase domain-containing protein n=1 Tax=Legionella lansingensis TaxID=45067 RepID=A0A0W0VTJ9_9GAMM|nr:alpha/beta hydrolase [Legionella lansingensis]KTD23479.1 hypothetical protein Llan_0850 [Legionella lansingensis]SNV50782.1 Predicted dienelactone hydrolase [Legionella lansingensis]